MSGASDDSDGSHDASRVVAGGVGAVVGGGRVGSGIARSAGSRWRSCGIGGAGSGRWRAFVVGRWVGSTVRRLLSLSRSTFWVGSTQSLVAGLRGCDGEPCTVTSCCLDRRCSVNEAVLIAVVCLQLCCSLLAEYMFVFSALRPSYVARIRSRFLVSRSRVVISMFVDNAVASGRYEEEQTGY